MLKFCHILQGLNNKTYIFLFAVVPHAHLKNLYAGAFFTRGVFMLVWHTRIHSIRFLHWLDYIGTHSIFKYYFSMPMIAALYENFKITAL